MKGTISVNTWQQVSDLKATVLDVATMLIEDDVITREELALRLLDTMILFECLDELCKDSIEINHLKNLQKMAGINK